MPLVNWRLMVMLTFTISRYEERRSTQVLKDFALGYIAMAFMESISIDTIVNDYEVVLSY
jgi:hypothetical protein